MRLLVVEDNVALAWRLQRSLHEQFDVQVARTGTEGQRLAETGRYDAIILDLGLPDMEGEEVCSALRYGGVATPIMILTAEDTVDVKVRLFEAGADDYLTKPFELAELRARTKALLRRRQLGAPPTILKIADLTIDPQRRAVQRGGVDIPLRRKEFDILEYLARNTGKVITQEMIFDHVWDEAGQKAWSNTVRVHIKHLRDKVDRPFERSLIKTVHGMGYTLESP